VAAGVLLMRFKWTVMQVLGICALAGLLLSFMH